MTISKRLINIDNPKASKSVKYGWLNGIHYMSPYDIAGVGNLCPDATPGCMALCLGYFSGQAAMVADYLDDESKNATRLSRDAKAQQFMENRKAYIAAFTKQMLAFVAEAKSLGLKPCVRFDGSTDTGYGLRLAREHSTIQFTDYTKNKRRAMDNATGKHPANYSVTFSHSEKNFADCLDILKAGGNVAVCMEDFPSTWHGFDVIDGDAHDLRHLDRRGVWVRLAPKGAARKDTSGFVVRNI